MEVGETPRNNNTMKANSNNMTSTPSSGGGERGGGGSENDGVASAPLLPNNHLQGKNQNIIESDDGLLDTSDLDINEPIIYQGSIFDPSDDDENFLIDPKGRPTKDNLKKTIKGFDEEEGQICPLVDRKSALLFDVVQNLEEEQINTSLKILQAVKYSGPIPLDWIQEYVDAKAESNPEIWSSWYLKIFDEDSGKSRREEKIVAAELAKQRKLVLGDEETIAGYAKAFDHGWTREVVVRMHQTPFNEVSETNPMSSIGEVFYRDPVGNKIRSMKQIAMTLEKSPVPGLSIKNFTFAKAPIGVGDPKKENLRKILSGRHPTTVSPYRPPQMKAKKVVKEMSGSSSSTYEYAPPPKSTTILSTPENINRVNEAKLKSSSSRRSIQPPKRYATGQPDIYPEKRSKPGPKPKAEVEHDHDIMEMGMLPPKYPIRGMEGRKEELFDDVAVRRRGRPSTKIKPTDSPSNGFNVEDDSALFQISAFHNHSQSTLFQGIDEATHDEDMYGGMSSMMETEGQETMMEDDGSEELLPCSIRCPGMTGEIPTLQCKRCLCLYHPECLALPPNLNFRNFLCANCETEPAEELQPTPPQIGRPPQGTGGPGLEAMKKLLSRTGKKPGEMTTTKKPPPPLLPAFPKFPMGNQSGAGKMLRMFSPKMGGGGGSLIQPPLSGRGGKTKMSSSSSMSLLRPSSDDSMSISPISMKRGRGRPKGWSPKNAGGLMSGLANRGNLTITPISIRGQRMPPPLPNLTPMGRGGLMPSLPKMGGKTGGGQRLMSSGGMSKGSRPGLPAISLSQGGPSASSSSAGSRIQETIFKELKDLSRAASTKQKGSLSMKSIGLPPFRRYPQSVVSIGTKKFVAVPRGNGSATIGGGDTKGKAIISNSKKMIPGGGGGKTTTTTISQTSTSSSNADTSMTVTAVRPESTQERQRLESKTEGNAVTIEPSNFQHRFDEDKEVAKQIFKYLNVKDLLRASRVSHTWNSVATDASLWKIVRMKNNRISDIEAFTQFLKKQQTQFVDFRKMISAGEMDWESLFKSLSDVPSLQQVQLTRSEELISLLSQHCPHIVATS